MEEMLRYFMTRTKDDFEELHGKIDHVTTRVDELWGWKYTVMGLVAGVSGVMSVLTTLLVIYLKAN